MNNIVWKRLNTVLTSVMFAVFITAAFNASAQTTGGVTDTKHNLSSAGLGTQTNSFSGTDEICVFCHTPHGADTTANPPLWNRAIGTTAYTTYDSLGTSTLDGEILTVGSVSIACLSCHDGTQAMNVIINAPGSGGYVAGGDAMVGTWTGPAATGVPVGSLGYDSIVNLGTDLTNDHPIGVEYAGGGCEAVAPGSTCTPAQANDPDFQDATHAAAGFWYVDVDNDSIRDKSDMILYTRQFAAGIGPSVECGSCHDPHEDTNPTFLRRSNTGSQVCLACHIK